VPPQEFGSENVLQLAGHWWLAHVPVEHWLATLVQQAPPAPTLLVELGMQLLPAQQQPACLPH
jgi:hypothetical protein